MVEQEKKVKRKKNAFEELLRKRPKDDKDRILAWKDPSGLQRRKRERGVTRRDNGRNTQTVAVRLKKMNFRRINGTVVY